MIRAFSMFLQISSWFTGSDVEAHVFHFIVFFIEKGVTFWVFLIKEKRLMSEIHWKWCLSHALYAWTRLLLCGSCVKTVSISVSDSSRYRPIGLSCASAAFSNQFKFNSKPNSSVEGKQIQMQHVIITLNSKNLFSFWRSTFVGTEINWIFF